MELIKKIYFCFVKVKGILKRAIIYQLFAVVERWEIMALATIEFFYLTL